MNAPFKTLRTPSARPELVISNKRSGVNDPSSQTLVGFAGPLGRERLIAALPLGNGPGMLLKHNVVHDQDGMYLADPDGNLIGFAGVWVSRMLTTRWTEDTRRLAV